MDKEKMTQTEEQTETTEVSEVEALKAENDRLRKELTAVLDRIGG